MLALALITLELETCCPDWLALTIDLLGKAQVCVRVSGSYSGLAGKENERVHLCLPSTRPPHSGSVWD